MPKGHKTRKTLDKEAARELLRDLVKAELRPMVEAQIKHAKGISYLVYREAKGGKFTKVTAEAAQSLFERDDVVIEVWEKEPSVQAFTDLLNRTVDKPAETVNATVDMSLTQGIEIRLKAARERLAKAKRGNGKPHS